jgi:hypothetical protein
MRHELVHADARREDRDCRTGEEHRHAEDAAAEIGLAET